jgi:hypothetical protein
LVGSIYGRSSIGIAHSVLIRLKTWPPQTILVSDWLISKKIFSSETALPNDMKLGTEEKNFKNQPIRNKSCLWRLCLLMDRDEMSNLYRGPSLDASYQVSGHLAQRFQMRRFFKIGPYEPKFGRKNLWKALISS